MGFNSGFKGLITKILLMQFSVCCSSFFPAVLWSQISEFYCWFSVFTEIHCRCWSFLQVLVFRVSVGWVATVWGIPCLDLQGGGGTFRKISPILPKASLKYRISLCLFFLLLSGTKF